MKKVIITSDNPIKKYLAQKVLSSLLPSDLFEYITLPLEKDGPEPIGKDAIHAQMRAALNRAREKIADAEYYICMEGGMVDDGRIMNETAYVFVENSQGELMISSCASFPVPTLIADEVRKGQSFAGAVDNFYKTTGTKQGGGFVSILTGGLIDKKDHYFQPLAIALSALIHRDWFIRRNS